MPQTFTSREFNQDTGSAKKAAESGPVIITDRGRPSHVLLTFADYQRMALGQPTLVDRLGEPPGVEEVDLILEPSLDRARPASLG